MIEERLKEVLTTKCKKELNQLYWQGLTNLDFGWFCREHALHIFLILAIYGYNPFLARGHVCVQMNEDENPLCTINSGMQDAHVWVGVDELVPIDLSINTHSWKGCKLAYVWGNPNPQVPFLYTLDERDFESLVKN